MGNPKPKSLIPSVRALDTIKAIHKTECLLLSAGEYEINKSKIIELKKKGMSEVVKKITNAINSLELPYNIHTKDVCNIVQYDGSLRIELVYDATKQPEAKQFKEANLKIESKRAQALKKLDQWYEKSLYKIASRMPIEEFKI